MFRRNQRKSRVLPFLAAITVLLSTAACEPKDRRPGAWLSGEEISAPADWSFVDDHPEVFVETRPWYGVPFSVTTVIASGSSKVFVPSIYDAPAAFPGSKYWNGIIAENPEVRVKIDGKLYRMFARPAADETEFEEGISALAVKYDFWREVHEGANPSVPYAIIRLTPRD